MIDEPRMTVFCVGDSAQRWRTKNHCFYINTNLEQRDFDYINNMMGQHFGFMFGYTVRFNANGSIADVCKSEDYPLLFAGSNENKITVGQFRRLAKKGFSFPLSYTQRAYEEAANSDMADNAFPESGDCELDEFCFKAIVMFVVKYMVEKLNLKGAVVYEVDPPTVGFHESGKGIFGDWTNDKR